MVWARGENEFSLARRVLMVDVSGGWVWGRPRFGWMYDMKMALDSRGMTVEAARQCAKDRKEWSIPGAHVDDCPSLTRPFLQGSMSFRIALPRSGGLSPGEGLDAVT